MAINNAASEIKLEQSESIAFHPRERIAARGRNDPRHLIEQRFLRRHRSYGHDGRGGSGVHDVLELFPQVGGLGGGEESG
jgi:hypothetical protein